MTSQTGACGAWRQATPRGDAIVRHGFSLEHLHVLAKMAVNSAFSRAADYPDRLEAAWFGICEHLCAAPDPPQSRELIHAGRAAVDQVTRDELRHHGTRNRDPYEGSRSASSFQRYWWDQARPAPSCENRVVDVVAMRQIWPRLSARHRQALAALAAFEDYQAAAASMGITVGTFNVHISKARKAFLVLWHEGEPPSRVWGTDRRRGNNSQPRERATAKRRPASRAVTRRAGRPETARTHGRATTYTNHQCRCIPCTQAAADEATRKRRARGIEPRKVITDTHRARAAELRHQGKPWREIGEILGFSQATVTRAVNGRERAAKTKRAVA
jgi:hypothetical protein